MTEQIIQLLSRRFENLFLSVFLLFFTVLSPGMSGASTIILPSVLEPQTAGDRVGFNLQNAGSSIQGSHYISFGQAFRQGQVTKTASLIAKINGSTIPVQMDVKTTYPDNSVRFAVITLLSPPLDAEATVSGMLAVGGANGASLDLSTALANYNVRVTFSGGISGTYDIGLRLQTALSNGTATYWLQGPLATQARVDIPIVGSFHLMADVTAYTDGTFSTDLLFNNDYAMQPIGGTVSYSTTVSQNGATVFSSGNLTHYQYQQWRKVIRSTGTPMINVQHDVADLIETGVFPNYDRTTGVDSSAISTITYEPLGTGGLTPYMPTTGDRPDIGPTTKVNTVWLLTQDKTAAASALAQADAAGSFPWHFFDPTTGDYLSLDHYPTLWADGRGNPTLTQFTTEPTWTLDTAHTPDPSFVPYVLTGERYHLDQLNAQATAVEFLSWNVPRQDGKGLVLNGIDQIRAQAWMIRSIDEAAWANPDGSAAKTYWAKILSNNYRNWIDVMIPALNASQGLLHGWFPGESRDSPPFIPSWQVDYLASSLAASALRGNADAVTILSWMANWSIGRLTNGANGMDPGKAAQYAFRMYDDSGQPFTSWAEVGAANSLQVPMNEDYAALVSMASAAIYNATGNAQALQGYNIFEALNPTLNALARYQNDYAKFHIVPKAIQRQNRFQTIEDIIAFLEQVLENGP